MDNDNHYTLSAPPGRTLCGSPPESFGSYGVFVPLDKNLRCEDIFTDSLPERVHFNRENFIDPDFYDNWVKFKEHCQPGKDIASAEFTESGNLVSGMPTRKCVRTYREGCIGILVFVRRGELDAKRSIPPKFYNIIAWGEPEHQAELDALLTLTLSVLKIRPLN